MNVTKIRLTGLYVVDLPLSVAQPGDSFIIKASDGLGPTGADVFISQGMYQGSQPLDREMVFRIGLNPNYRIDQTAGELRERLYGMLTPESEDGSILVEFLFGETVVARTTGHVSKIEPVLFAKEPEVQLTIPCLGAYLESPDVVTVVPTTKDQFTIKNVGTAPAGIEIEIVLTSDRTSWTLIFGSKRMRFEYGFKAGDILRVNTREYERSVAVVRGGVTTEIIQSLTANSSWLQLHGGDNLFITGARTFDWGYIRYRPLYLGV